MTLTRVVELLAVELSLLVLRLSSVSAGILTFRIRGERQTDCTTSAAEDMVKKFKVKEWNWEQKHFCAAQKI